ncbi:hypothetical protein U1Q18_051782, partial [Sarracenia purpurea var. burkii]
MTRQFSSIAVYVELPAHGSQVINLEAARRIRPYNVFLLATSTRGYVYQTVRLNKREENEDTFRE